MKKSREFLPATEAAAATLGAQIAAARRERGWTAAEFAERLGASQPTVARLERGAPTVALGLALEAAVLCGVELYNGPDADLPSAAANARARLALLPNRVRTSRIQDIDDDF